MKADPQSLKNALNELDEFLQNAEQEVTYKLAYIGEQARNIAVEKVAKAPTEKGYYKDRTRHLVGSIGYVIARKRQAALKGTFNGLASHEALTYASELANNNQQGVTLIVVAGKDYASHVANRGYDVLDSAKLEAEHLAEQIFGK